MSVDELAAHLAHLRALGFGEFDVVAHVPFEGGHVPHMVTQVVSFPTLAGKTGVAVALHLE